MIFRLSKDSFWTIFSIALTFGCLIRAAVLLRKYVDEEIGSPKDITLPLMRISEPQCTLDYFMAGQSTRLGLLQTKYLKPHEKEFAAINNNLIEEHKTVNSEANSCNKGNENEAIIPSAAIGVTLM